MTNESISLLLATLAALIATGLCIYGIARAFCASAARGRARPSVHAHGLVRDAQNPLLLPHGHSWEAGGVMNPAALAAGGRTHLFYRAIGNDGVSRLGYASSSDGVSIDERLPYPVFALAGGTQPGARRFAEHAGLMASGGSFAGVEDPRAVVIGDRVHISFSAFAGWESLRIGLTSIAIKDLLEKRWQWTPPTYLSPKGQVHKNWVLFPEKIKGKFAVLHSLHSGTRDRVLVDYLDTLDETAIESPYLPSRNDALWDSTLRGAGPPPIRTEKGWLLLYHATDAREPHRYKIGALLLDLINPSKVIARSSAPILAPDASYENDGAKEGVVYACGLVRTGDMLRVYYGGSDSVVCSAATSLSGLLKKLAPVPQLSFA